jgi:hypothetical protein
MGILKTTIDIGDNIKYKHPLNHPFDGMFATVEGVIIGYSSGLYHVSIPLKSFSQKERLELFVPIESLELIEKIPDPNWLSDRIAKATQVKEGNYDGKYFYDNVSEHLFKKSGDLYEYYREYEMLEELPRYAFAAKPRVHKISEVEDQLASKLWSNDDNVNLRYVDELQSAIDKFNSANQDKMTEYRPDYTTIVILNLPDF